ncbi:MAG: DUF2325 domain-containing protein [Oscillospiraceae bacterium]|nr:DUF2325 domain-containing protein [Oscillospiraceae bacterium]
MSVVIVGGHERMTSQYEEVCKNFGCKPKVYPKESGSMKKKMGNADLLILFTSTVSHKMAISAVQEAKRTGTGTAIARVHSSSATALQAVLQEHCG